MSIAKLPPWQEGGYTERLCNLDLIFLSRDFFPRVTQVFLTTPSPAGEAGRKKQQEAGGGPGAGHTALGPVAVCYSVP
jgi:hypothetical protein